MDSLESMLDDISCFVNSYSGISPKRIEFLLNEALKNEEKTKPAKPSETCSNRKKRHTWRSFLCIVFVILNIVGISLMLLLFSSPDLQDYVDKQANAIFQSKTVINLTNKTDWTSFLHSYILKPLRILSISFGLPGIKAFNSQGCMLSNPLRDLKEKDCSCSGVKHILTPKSGTDQLIPFQLPADQPVVFRNWCKNVSLEDLQTQIDANAHILQRLPTFFSSTVDSITAAEDLGKKQLLNLAIRQKNSHTVWATTHYSVSQVIRKLFPHVPILFHHGRTFSSFEKILLLDGSDSGPYRLPTDLIGSQQSSSVSYMQGLGGRKVILIPRKGCESQCLHLSTRLKAGDILVYQPDTWIARSEPFNDSTSLASIAFSGQMM